LIPQQAEPLLGRALSYLALGQAKEAAADLDEAVQDDPNNAQAWIARGLAYEQLGDKTRAAGCYGRAITLRPKTTPHDPPSPASAASPARATKHSEIIC
jgi:Tfp pilus assembly protein PilF